MSKKRLISLILIISGWLFIFPSFVFAKLSDDLINRLELNIYNIYEIGNISNQLISDNYLKTLFDDDYLKENIPKLESNLAEFMKNNILIEKNIIALEKDNDENYISYVKLSFDLETDIQDLIDMFSHLNNFKIKIHESNLNIRRIIEKILVDSGYSRDEFKNLMTNQIDDKQLYLDLNKKLISFFNELSLYDELLSQSEELNKIEINESLIPFKELILSEEKLLLDTFMMIKKDVAKKKLELLNGFIRGELNEEDLVVLDSFQHILDIDRDVLIEKLDIMHNDFEDVSSALTTFLSDVNTVIVSSSKENIKTVSGEIVKTIVMQNETGDSMVVSLDADGNPIIDKNLTKYELLESEKDTQKKMEMIDDKLKKLDDKLGHKPVKDVFNIWDLLKVLIPILTIFIGFLVTRRKKHKFSKYLKEVDNIYAEYKLKTKRLEAELYRLKDMIMEDLGRGKIDESAFTIVEKRIDQYMAEVREQEINDQFGGLPQNLRQNMHKMLQDGKITNHEYDHLSKILESSTLSERDKDSLMNTFKNWKNEDNKK